MKAIRNEWTEGMQGLPGRYKHLFQATENNILPYHAFVSDNTYIKSKCMTIPLKEFKKIFIMNHIKIIGNCARMVADDLRMFLNMILVLEQPSKVQFWTSKQIFEFLYLLKNQFSSIIHFFITNFQFSVVGKVPMDHTHHFDFHRKI